MVYHWQSQNVKISGVDDMVLLPKVNEDAIIENLKKRYLDGYIYLTVSKDEASSDAVSVFCQKDGKKEWQETCIGPVLVSINPFKQMPYFGEKEIELYQGAAPYENPPHIYSLADDMYRNMLIDAENQCVIISGESGAGKTVSAKYIMSYIAKISGGGRNVQKVKDIILESNPLLESFGNAKTVRNNNSSRFGKYVEIQFGNGGEPKGGKISNFLLEKSRVTCHSAGERNFHIFYQLVTGANPQLKREFGIVNLTYYNYLNYGNDCKVDGTNDAQDFLETLKGLSVMGIEDTEASDILRLVAGILHIGNINFVEYGNYSQVADKKFLEFPAFLLGISPEQLSHKLTSREFESKWGKESESLDVTLNVEQALYARDALAKDIYARLFDYLVKKVNSAIENASESYKIGILDIYGFEIFEKNGFEQFCINFVNEKMQQIFIELTLKAEQEEYVAENIKWTAIDYFNNAVVVELLEGKKLPGLFLIVDDVCATLHGGSTGADSDLQKKVARAYNNHAHFQQTSDGFAIRHYAGVVLYSVDGFCDKNRDVLFLDLIELMKTSTNSLVRVIYPEEEQAAKTKTLKSRPTTAGSKIRSQASRLVSQLMKCTPHYIRCIKPNETKKPQDWDPVTVRHQVEYLGLKENIRVRRAGFAYRRTFAKFLHRYAILTKETWPIWNGDEKQGVEWILSSVHIDKSQYQLGCTKVFIKAPESLFMLEEARDRKYNMCARVIQRAFKKYFAKKRQAKQEEEAADLLYGHKQRRQASLNRHFVGDYIGVDMNPRIISLIGKKEKVLYAEVVKKYDRRFKVSRRDFILTTKYLYLIGRETAKKDPGKGKLIETIKRKLSFDQISHISLSCLKDDFVIVHIREDYASLLQMTFKTEMLSLLNKQYTEATGHQLNIRFSNILEFKVKKEGWGGGGNRQVQFIQLDYGDKEVLHSRGKVLTVSIGPGLPSTSKPNGNRRIIKNDILKIQSKSPRSIQQPQLAPPKPLRPAPKPFVSSTIEQRSVIKPQNTSGIPRNSPMLQERIPPWKTFEKSNIVTPNNTENKGKGSKMPIPKKLQNIKMPIMGMFINPGAKSRGLVKAPPPPAEPAPPNQPTIHGAFRLPPINGKTYENDTVENRTGLNGTIPNKTQQTGYRNNNELYENWSRDNIIQQTTDEISTKQMPPYKAPVTEMQKVKVLYDYSAKDLDELELKEDDIIQVLKEHEGGWWLGRLREKVGLFPSNYTEKIT